ncbi:16S rRNA (uracil1498-N3)-methyltransferase [Andreprevotia lacus DSM 23236]|jgi:16S rRNA (uracil1498-N3)-methyltransferase|uniref:Ribosomal RNA small subunit methyltransferase E n=1 Tax=Andreprevotia lacus DSM 23236 TaxID=1121001 RepID=A0A1W1XSY2_9NEIS|nr:16S rRNA (uracil(1498)-N(3))-methyltransferase [Andreprevotia lacus]SMC26661.1 16S rRNA (uracil1498-N3)-methyltransferase [Andreprevotia lacus DSM 23236]
MPRFYLDQPLQAGAGLGLPEGVARHVQVLRMQPGETITLFNGQGGEYSATITAMGKKTVDVQVGEHQAAERESPLQLVLVQAVSASERMDYTIQKATELGVTRIVPVYSQYCQQRMSGERADKRLAHWRAVAQAACEQCERTRVPQIDAVIALDKWLAQPLDAALKLLLSPAGAIRAAELPAAAASAAVLVGPEGGLSPDEEAAARAAGYQPIILGPRILRTETAGPAMAAILQARYGDY